MLRNNTQVGELGETSMQSLSPDDPEKAFERGATDTFTITCTDVGELKAVKAQISANWWRPMHSDWKLGEVQVRVRRDAFECVDDVKMVPT